MDGGRQCDVPEGAAGLLRAAALKSVGSCRESMASPPLPAPPYHGRREPDQAEHRRGTLPRAVTVLAVVTLACVRWFGMTNAATVATSYLMVVLVIAATSPLRVAIATSVAAMLALNFFFLPPVGTFSIADPQNWVALFAFLAVSLVASHLSAQARDRADEALSRRDELARLFDLGRDVLLITDSRDALTSLARAIGRRFDLEFVAIALPRERGVGGLRGRYVRHVATTGARQRVRLGPGLARLRRQVPDLCRAPRRRGRRPRRAARPPARRHEADRAARRRRPRRRGRHARHAGRPGRDRDRAGAAARRTPGRGDGPAERPAEVGAAGLDQP